MGAAISLALSIALAIQEAVPGGIGGIELETITGTEIMKDEITPDDEVSSSN